MLAFKYEDKQMFIPVCILLSIVSVLRNLNRSKVWWNRNTHLLNGLSVLAVSVAGYPNFVKYILVSDVFNGFFMSIQNSDW